MSRKRQANLLDIQNAIEVHQPFAAIPGVELEIVLPEPFPDHKVYKGRKHRAYISRRDTGQILVTAPSAYALLDKLQEGWKYELDKREGLWAPPIGNPGS